MAAKKVKALPRIDATGMPGFLLWARRDAPGLYAGLVQRFPEVRGFEEALTLATDVDGRGGVAGLGDFSDVLSSIGSSVGSVAGSIGSFVANNGMQLLSTAASVYSAAQTFKLANKQLDVAAAGGAPMQTAVTYNPQTGQPQLTAIGPSGNVLTSRGVVPGGYYAGNVPMRSAGLPSWMLYGGLGIGALVLILALRK